MAENHVLAQPYNRLTIDDLPDDALLEIFDFYVVRYQDLDSIEMVSGGQDTIRKIRSWQSLVHVCRRWRCLVFASPRRLNLQLCCTTRSLARSTLDVWPALPLLIQGHVSETSVNDVIAALKHGDRICQIKLVSDPTSQIEKFWTAIQVPFPELAVLHLHGIPHSGYISPEVMATCLSMLTSLESLRLEFESPLSCPDQESRRPSPRTRSVLPALTMFWFKGANEYSEELLARIDTPRLYLLWATFFNDIDFYTPELIKFIKLTSGAPKDVHVVFDSHTAWVKLQRQTSFFAYVKLEISCRVPVWQLSSLAQICTSSLPLLSTTENLYIYEDSQSQLDWKDGIENIEWLELLLPFIAVKDLYLSEQLAPRIAPALQELTEGRTTDMLPTLQNIFLEGFQPSKLVHEGIEQFISARELTDRPLAISVWERVNKPRPLKYRYSGPFYAASGGPSVDPRLSVEHAQVSRYSALEAIELEPYPLGFRHPQSPGPMTEVWLPSQGPADMQNPSGSGSFLKSLTEDNRTRRAMVTSGPFTPKWPAAPQEFDLSAQNDWQPQFRDPEPFFGDSGKRRALIIGINYSRHPVPGFKLKKCIEDAYGMAIFLRANLGFEHDDIRVITDENPWDLPTAENIMEAMSALVYDAQPNDSLLLYYSGHALQIKNISGQESYGLAECICAMDYQGDPYRNSNTPGLISDDTMHRLMVNPLPPECRLTTIFDSCHSGGLLGLPHPYDSNGLVIPLRQPERLRILRQKSTYADVVSLSASKDEQEAIETERGGALQWAFIESVRNLGDSLTYKDLLRGVRDYMRRHGFPQRPQLSSSYEIIPRSRSWHKKATIELINIQLASPEASYQDMFGWKCVRWSLRLPHS